MTTKNELIPCPFVYAKGRKCTGHIVGVEAYEADLGWCIDADGQWRFSVGQPQSHYHLRCSEKDNHAGYGRPDAEQLKCYWSDLPKPLSEAMTAAEKRGSA